MLNVLQECQGCNNFSDNQLSTARVLAFEVSQNSLGPLRSMIREFSQHPIFTHNTQEAMRLFLAQTPDIVMVQATNSSALEFCEWIRNRSNTPILVITNRQSPLTEEDCLKSGADDYILQPFSKSIVISRMAQQLSRSKISNKKDKLEQQIRFGNLELDLLSYRFFIGGNEIGLSTSEFHLLELFMKAPIRVFNRVQMLEIIGVPQGPGTDHIINSHISRLRLKIRKSGGPDIFLPVRGIGFRFANSEEDEEKVSGAGRFAPGILQGVS